MAELWVVLPTVDEHDNLARLLPRLLQTLGGQPLSARVLIVDDGSEDGTAELVARLAAAGAPVALLQRPRRQGLGSALRAGLQAALADPACRWIVTMDADGSHDPADLPSLLAARDGAGVVQGSRYVPGGRILGWSRVRRVLSRAANAAWRTVAQTRLHEHTTNFRLYARAAAETAAQCHERGWEWVVAALLAVQRAGFRIVEAPITFVDRQAGRSKLGFSDLVAWAAYLWRDGRRRAPLRRVPAWVWWGAGLRLVALLLLGHWYDLYVFRDVSLRLVEGQGVYAPHPLWLATHGEGYYVYPPLYAYVLALAGLAARAVGGGWYLHALAIKLPLLAADLLTACVLWRWRPAAAVRYWTLWFVPLLAIAQVQPDVWVGLLVLLAYLAAAAGRWPWAGVLVGLGAAVKFTPALIVPFAVLFLLHRRAWRTALAFAATAAAISVLAWLPYVLLYDDAWHFAQALEFHLRRVGGGLTPITTVVTGYTALYLNLRLPSGAPHPAVVQEAIGGSYGLLTAAVFLLLLAMALRRPWALGVTFWVPVGAFLAANKVTNEQYLLQVLPLALLVRPDLVRALFWPFTVYVLTAGTPVRYLPREINPWLPGLDLGTGTLAVTLLMALAALLFALRLARQVAAAALTGRDDPHAPVPLPVPAAPAAPPMAPPDRRRVPWHFPAGALATAAVVLLVTTLLHQRGPSQGLTVRPVSALVDLTGTGTVTLFAVRAENRTDVALPLRFLLRQTGRESGWVTLDGQPGVTVEPGGVVEVVLIPQRFDRTPRLAGRAELMALAPGTNLIARTPVPQDLPVRQARLWHIDGARARPHTGTVLLSEAPGVEGRIRPTCLDGRLALRLEVERREGSAPEWAVAQIRYVLAPEAARALEPGPLRVAVHGAGPLMERGGWPLGGQSLTLQDHQGAHLQVVFTRDAARTLQPAPHRLLVARHLPWPGWNDVALRLAPHLRALGWSWDGPVVLSLEAALHRERPGRLSAAFGVVDSEGAPLPCAFLLLEDSRAMLRDGAR